MRVNVPSVAPQFLRSRIGKVCVAIIGSTAAEMLEKASAVVKETPFLEFRLDYLEKPLLALPKLKQFFTDNTAATGIATLRLPQRWPCSNTSWAICSSTATTTPTTWPR